MSEPSLLDLVRARLPRRRLLRVLLLAAALGALAFAAHLLASPGVSPVRPFAWTAVAVALGEAARRAGRSGSAEPPAPAGARRRPDAATVALVALVLVGAGFRLAWARWDSGALLHPDEYGLTGTLTKLSFPKSLAEWFDTARSPMSPYPRYDAEGRRLPGEAPDAAMRWGQAPQLIVRGAAELLSGDPARGGTDFTSFAELRVLGRRLSALASLLTLVALCLVASRLAGERTALLAAALAALAPLPLQQARFLTVDGFAALFATAALLPALRVSEARPERRAPLRPAALFGLLAALAVASRLNLAPIVLLLPAALLFRSRGLPAGQRLRRAAAPALLGALVFLATFRVAQPFSFRAARGETTLLTLAPNPDWLRNVELARAESALRSSSPPAEQWAGRTRVLFPALNTFLWGLGPPGGLLALAGLGLCLGALRAGRPRPPDGVVLLAAWTVLFFLFMAARPVSSVRYFLPLYPLFALLGALALERLLAARTRAARAATPALLLLALAWAFGFTEAWRKPNTRIAASRALFENVPVATSLLLDEGSGARRVPLRSAPVASSEGGVVLVGIPHGTRGTLRGVHFAHLRGEGGAELGVVLQESGGGAPIARGSWSLPATSRHPFGDAAPIPVGPVVLDPARRYELVFTTRGGPVGVHTSVVFGETWDEVLPCAVDGLDAGLLDLRLVPVRGPDDAAKREAILRALEEADAVVLSSPRSLWAAPRLPTNYPLTLAYYRALFDGRLGFAPLPGSPFQSPVRLGPFRISEAAGTVAWGRPPELPFAGGSPLAAEEAFFVYDRAPVWIFARTTHRSRAELEALLPPSLLEEVVPLTPLQAGAAPGALALPPERLGREAAGAGRDAPPSPRAAPNRHPALAVVAWAALLALLGVAALPVAASALGRLPAVAFASARLAGLLAVGWLAWLLGSLRAVPFGRGALLLALAALVAVGGSVAWRDRERLVPFLGRERSTLLATELVFHVLFGLGLLLRYGNPDLWHPWLGGEKPMAFAFLNGLLRTSELPPQHPWFAGGTLNYYYFGYVLAAVPARLLGLVPGLAYNLAVPTFFALAGSGAFALGHALVRRAKERDERRPAGAPLLAGLLSAALLVLLGNLGQLRVLLRALQALAGDAAGRLDPILVAAGALKALAGAPLPLRPEDWYWNATRLVPAVAGSGSEITEFPYFTALFADLHPHLMALPIGLLLLGWALAAREGPSERRADRWTLLALGALALGALRATNPWDVPVLLAVAVAAGAAGVLASAGGRRPLAVAVGALGPLLLSLLLFRPFDASYVAPYGDVSLWRGAATPLAAWLWLWGLPAFAVASLVSYELARRLAETPASVLAAPAFWRSPAVLGGVAAGVGLAAWLAAGVPAAVAAWPLAAAALAAAWPRSADPAPERRLVLLAAAGAFLVTLGVDRWAVGGDRMNTVFKLGFQAFALLAVASGPALAWTHAALRSEGRTRPGAWHAATALLLASAALYPLTATPARLAQRFPRVASGEACRPFAGAPGPPAALGSGEGGRPRGLDGTAFLADAAICAEGRLVPLGYDGEALAWLRAHEAGSPSILEAVLPEYRWGSRFSVHTGLPAVVGWSWHVRQHRAAVPGALVEKRIEDVTRFYRSRLAAPGEGPGEGRTTVEEARRFLARYRVRWVVAGLLERAVYGEEVLAKLSELERLGLLEAAYRNAGVTLYRVRGAGPR